MKRIGHTIKIYDFLYKFIMGQSLKKIMLPQPPENLLCMAFYLLRRCEPCTLFADIDCAHLSCPVTQVRKTEPVDCLVMCKVKIFDFQCI